MRRRVPCKMHKDGERMNMIYTTCKSSNEAEKIAKHLLKNKIVACANIFPIKSMYNWKGKLVLDKEVVLILKSNKNYKIIEKEIKKIHSYKTPFIGQININVNKEYTSWANE